MIRCAVTIVAQDFKVSQNINWGVKTKRKNSIFLHRHYPDQVPALT